jgi:hypothetical protein
VKTINPAAALLPVSDFAQTIRAITIAQSPNCETVQPKRKIRASRIARTARINSASRR